MIPILFEKTELSFTSNGLGRLADCIRCLVTEERNGIYECEFDYPVGGVNFDAIQIGRIIGCTHDEQGDIQPFDVYAKSEPIDGIVTFHAHHISYRLNEITVKPFTAGSCVEALTKINTQSVVANPFSFWTNKSVTASYTSDVPRRARAMLAGEENSILDVFGTGEYEFNRFEVRLHTRRGQDTNVSIRYGKNLVDFDNDQDASEAYTAVVPYWIGDVSQGETSTTQLVTLPEWYISSGKTIPSGREVLQPMDLSGDFEEKPTVAQLRAKATARLQASDGWIPKQTIKVDFVQLWQTEEYADYAPLQRLSLCDTCGVFVPMYNISVRAKIIRVVYNVLLDRYDEMELGDKPTSYSAVIEKQFNSKVAGVYQGFQAIKVSVQTAEQRAASDATSKANNALASAKSYADGQIASAKRTIEGEYQQAIDDATEQITGGTGGYVITTLNANNQPIELLITDNIDINRAVNVWRWNQGGLGHSHSGYNGPFNDVAITQDGKINASMITTGRLTANLIRAGILQDVNGYVVFNLDTGTLAMTKGSINLGNGKFVATDAGKLTATGGGLIQDEGAKNYWNLDSAELVATKGSIAKFDINGNELKSDYYSGSTLSSQVAVRSGWYLGADAGFSVANTVAKNRLNLNGMQFLYTLDGATDPANITKGFRIDRYTFSSTTPHGYLVVADDYSGSLKLSAIELHDGSYNTPRHLRINRGVMITGETYIAGGFTATGSKSRAVKTPNYTDRLLYCYETPTPLFGDIGEATIDEDGFAYVDIDDIFSETVAERVEYQVFLQKEGQGDCWIAEKAPRYFVIQGTPNLKVAWELKARQRDYENIRLEQFETGLEEYANDSDPLDYTEDSYIEEQEELLYG